MQNEILKPVLETDDLAVPRYDVVTPNGSVAFENVELRLKNEVVQEGTPYSEEAVMPTELREKLELGKEATPGQAFLELLNRGGGAVRRNRPPVSTDAETVGKLWMIPTMTFNNLMPNAVTQSASNWVVAGATASVATDAVTITGDGSNSLFVATATMSKSVAVNHKVYVRSVLTAVQDANEILFEVVHNGVVSATYSWQFPTAGATYDFSEVVTTTENGQLQLRVTAKYNTAAVQSGKNVKVSAITVLDMTTDMCEAQEGNEFTASEAYSYLATYGNFQSRVYEFSSQFWLLVSVTDSVFDWVNISGIVSSVGDIKYTNTAPPDGTWLPCDGSMIDKSTYPELYDKLPFTLQGDFEQTTLSSSILTNYSSNTVGNNMVLFYNNKLYWGSHDGGTSPYRLYAHTYDVTTGETTKHTIATFTSSNYPFGSIRFTVCKDFIYAFTEAYISTSSRSHRVYYSPVNSFGKFTKTTFGWSAWSDTQTKYYTNPEWMFYSNGYYVVLIATGGKYTVSISTNGTSWTAMPQSMGNNSYTPCLAFVYNKHVYVYSLYDKAFMLAYSNNLTTSATFAESSLDTGASYIVPIGAKRFGDTVYVLMRYMYESDYAYSCFTLAVSATDLNTTTWGTMSPFGVEGVDTSVASFRMYNHSYVDEAFVLVCTFSDYLGEFLVVYDPRKSNIVPVENISSFSARYILRGNSIDDIDHVVGVMYPGYNFYSGNQQSKILVFDKDKTLPLLNTNNNVFMKARM